MEKLKTVVALRERERESYTLEAKKKMTKG